MKGYPFPALDLLQRAMALRGWNRETLAEKAGISSTLAGRVLAGKSVSIDTNEAVARALRDNPPATALAEFLAESAS